MKYIISIICGVSLGLLIGIILNELGFSKFTQAVFVGLVAGLTNRIVKEYIEIKKI